MVVLLLQRQGESSFFILDDRNGQDTASVKAWEAIQGEKYPYATGDGLYAHPTSNQGEYTINVSIIENSASAPQFSKHIIHPIRDFIRGAGGKPGIAELIYKKILNPGGAVMQAIQGMLVIAVALAGFYCLCLD